MVGTRYYPRTNSLCHPYPVNEVTNGTLHLDQVTSAKAKTPGIFGVHPYRILMRNLIEPFGVAGAAVNQSRQTKGRKQQHLALVGINVVAMYVTPYICGNG